MELQVAVERIEHLADADVGRTVEHVSGVGRGHRAGQRVGRTEGTSQISRRVEVDGAHRMLREPAKVIVERQATNAIPREADFVRLPGGKGHIAGRSIGLEAREHVERVRGRETGRAVIVLVTEVVAQLLAEHVPAGVDREQVDLFQVHARRILDRSPLADGERRAVEVGRNRAKPAEERGRRCGGTGAAGARHLGIDRLVGGATLIHRLERQRVGRLEQQRGAERAIVGLGLDRAVNAVDPVGFAVLDIGGEAQRQHVLDDRQVEPGLQVPMVGGAMEPLHVTTELGEVGLPGGDGERARNRRRATRRALRPAQHFDLVDVKQRHDSLARIERHFVEVQRRGRRTRTRLPGHAAQGDLGAGVGIDQGQARRQLADFIDLGDRQLLKLGA